MDWDAGRVSSMGMEAAHEVAARDAQDTSPVAIQKRLLEFLRSFRVGPLFFYREQLIANYRRGNHFFTLQLSHLAAYDQLLQDLVLKSPKEYLPLIENAAKEMLAYLLVLSSASANEDVTLAGADASSAAASSNLKNLPDIQVILKSEQRATPLRQVHAQEINRLVKVPGIIISATRVRTKCVAATLRCKNCGNNKRVAVSGLGGIHIPRNCDRNRDEETAATGDACPKDSYVVVPDRCDYVDQQTLKLQENPEVVPTGEMPRNLALIADRHLVDRASPGTRVSIVGITSVVNAANKQVGAVAIRTLYLRVVGIEVRLTWNILAAASARRTHCGNDCRLMKTAPVARGQRSRHRRRKSSTRWRATQSCTTSSRAASLRPSTATTRPTSKRRSRACWSAARASACPMA